MATSAPRPRLTGQPVSRPTRVPSAPVPGVIPSAVMALELHDPALARLGAEYADLRAEFERISRRMDEISPVLRASLGHRSLELPGATLSLFHSQNRTYMVQAVQTLIGNEQLLTCVKVDADRFTKRAAELGFSAQQVRATLNSTPRTPSIRVTRTAGSP